MAATASTAFLFLACLANAIAFGGLTSLMTEGQIGTAEMIVATALGGIVFALCAGQPLTILGGTGPIVRRRLWPGHGNRHHERVRDRTTRDSVQRAAIPEVFDTTTGRAWRIDLFSIPNWAIFAAIGPALLVTVLLFLDQNITTRLVNSPLHALRKGAGYHLDLAIVGVITAVFSLFALPWIVAATVHSLNHVKSLATTETVNLGTDVAVDWGHSDGRVIRPIPIHGPHDLA